MKNLLRFAIAVFAITIVSTSIVSAASYKRNPDDTESRGDWMGKYGSDGYFIVGDDSTEDIDKIPSYASLAFEGSLGGIPGKWTWYDSETSIDEVDESRIPTALFIDEAKTIRRSSCYFDTDLFSVTVDVGSESKVVSLYFADFDEGGRDQYISVYDETGTEIDAIEIYSFQDGVYISTLISGKITFEIIKVGGPNVVISAVFFDPDPNAPAVESAPEAAAEEANDVLPEEAPSDINIAPLSEPKSEPDISSEAPQTNDGVAVIIIAGLVSLISFKYIRKQKI